MVGKNMPRIDAIAAVFYAVLGVCGFFAIPAMGLGAVFIAVVGTVASLIYLFKTDSY